MEIPLPGPPRKWNFQVFCFRNAQGYQCYVCMCVEVLHLKQELVPGRLTQNPDLRSKSFKSLTQRPKFRKQSLTKNCNSRQQKSVNLKHMHDHITYAYIYIYICIYIYIYIYIFIPMYHLCIYRVEAQIEEK